MNLNDASNYANKMMHNKWVQWIHLSTFPSINQVIRVMNTALGYTTRHCAKCRNLNGCCFSENNLPEYPLHPNCHCVIIIMPYVSVLCSCNIIKFTEYIFGLVNNKGKKDLFGKWGYSILDSENLKEEFEKQAKLKYQCGDYVLGLLNDHGQRINIEIILKNKKTGDDIKFYSGWMVYPSGKLVLTTPYGGVKK